ncbi:hypothetical protein CYMTET_48758 [Cymbomonas tetramitiformis]|uniref:WW domain-containing protein n=1 Tax=Cymbomonas tetramitiformis TaxID=36881 RepID=A0AAE0EUM3_9CHLO|nr:hypothetical protein CYMTET_48758 [Cymbomonas tetramitiformis]
MKTTLFFLLCASGALGVSVSGKQQYFDADGNSFYLEDFSSEEMQTDANAPASQEWERYFDKNNGNRAYYHNAKTGVSQWEQPEGWAESGSNARSTGDAGSGLSTSDAENGWQQAVDPKSQKVYYYNTATGVSQWEKPLGLAGAGIASSSSSSRPNAAVSKATTEGEWHEALDMATQKLYYWNSATKQSTWERPAGHIVERPASSGGPGEWKQELDPKSGRAYFWNTATMAVTWDRPAHVEMRRRVMM